MKYIFILLALSLCGCANMSEREKQTAVIAGSILVGAVIIADKSDHVVNNCISTRSLETGCRDRP